VSRARREISLAHHGVLPVPGRAGPILFRGLQALCRALEDALVAISRVAGTTACEWEPRVGDRCGREWGAREGQARRRPGTSWKRRPMRSSPTPLQAGPSASSAWPRGLSELGTNT